MRPSARARRRVASSTVCSSGVCTVSTLSSVRVAALSAPTRRCCRLTGRNFLNLSAIELTVGPSGCSRCTAGRSGADAQELGLLRKRLQVDFLPARACGVGVRMAEPGRGVARRARCDATKASTPRRPTRRSISSAQLTSSSSLSATSRDCARAASLDARRRGRAGDEGRQLDHAVEAAAQVGHAEEPGLRCRARAAAASTERSRRPGRAGTGTSRRRPRRRATRRTRPTVRAACRRLASRDWKARRASRLAMDGRTLRDQASALILAISSAALTGLTM